MVRFDSWRAAMVEESADLEPNAYGYRPQESVQDAIQKVKELLHATVRALTNFCSVPGGMNADETGQFLREKAQEICSR